LGFGIWDLEFRIDKYLCQMQLLKSSVVNLLKLLLRS
jgi:hypothetical protein